MGKFSLSSKKTILLSFVAAFFSIFTVATISIFPMNNANAAIYDTCAEINNAPYDSFCDYDRDTSTDYYDDCIRGVNCNAGTDFYWENSAWNTYNSIRERADIDVNLNQLLHCDNGDVNCRTDAINDAFHKVDVRSLGNSYANFEVDMDMDQINDGHEQDNYQYNNYGDQQFLACLNGVIVLGNCIAGTGTSTGTAKLLANGDGEDVQFVMQQENLQGDDSINENEAYQEYNIQSQGSSLVNLARDDQGFAVYQTNNGCDVDDNVAPGTVSCSNYSEQGVDILTLNPSSTTSNRATVIYDSLGLSTTTQSHNCEFDVITCVNEAYSNVFISASGTSTSNRVDFDDAEQDIAQSTDCNDSTGTTGIFCTNYADLDMNVGTTGASRVNVDFAEQDVSQTLDCDNANGGDCLNQATVNLAIAAGEDPGTAADGVVNAEGSQIARQSITCDGSDCENIADMFVGLGVDTGGGLDPVTGTLNADYDQTVTQTADCDDAATCNNNIIMHYFATAKEGSIVTSTSDQTATQSTFCTDKTCNNNGIMINNVFAEDTARLTATSTQSLTQTCSDAVVGPCNNNNVQTTSGSAISNAIFTYTTSQTLNNGPAASGNGDQSITLQCSGGTCPSQTVTQTQPGQTYTFPPPP